MRSCEIVEVRNVEDALGDPCSKRLGRHALIAVVACALLLHHVMCAALYSVRSLLLISFEAASEARFSRAPET